ncbi:MAG: dephospho-CoA kinase [Thalassovita sp.]
MSFLLGLTGSIGMGKSATARLFEQQGCALWDADAAVHRLYAENGLAVAPLAALCPEAIIDNAVSRPALKVAIAQDAGLLKKIETIVHPLVSADRADFIRETSANIVVFDIPLLFETGADAQMDAVVTVSISPEIQFDRVMARGTMSKDQFQAILAKQMPDAEKRRRADYVIVTDTPDHAAEQVQDVLADITRRLADA